MFEIADVFEPLGWCSVFVLAMPAPVLAALLKRARAKRRRETKRFARAARASLSSRRSARQIETRVRPG
jgi:hypothetical protein